MADRNGIERKREPKNQGVPAVRAGILDGLQIALRDAFVAKWPQAPKLPASDTLTGGSKLGSDGEFADGSVEGNQFAGLISRGVIIGLLNAREFNGQQELAEAIIGLRPLDQGQILLADRDISNLDARERFGLGLAHIPNDRKREGLIGSMGIGQNLMLKRHRSPPFSTHGIMHWLRVRESAAKLAKEFNIRTGSLDTPISTLSGGNQQKVVLARELGVAQPRIIIAMNPTRGLDVAAMRFVHEQLLAHRSRGAGILLISSELEEILQLSHRIGVLFRGRLTMSDFPREGVEKIGRLMAGLSD